MDISVLGWILSIANINDLGGPTYQLKDMSVEVEKVSKLKETMLSYPGVILDDFKESGFHRYGDVALFASNPLRKYLFGGSTDPEEKALLIILFYEPRQIQDGVTQKPEPLHFMIPNANLKEDVIRHLLRYADAEIKSRNKNPGLQVVDLRSVGRPLDSHPFIAKA